MSTKSTHVISAQVHDLAAYFPGRGRFNWLWILAVPALVAFGNFLLGAHILEVKSSSAALLIAAERGAALPSTCMLHVGALVLLARAYRARPRAWPDIASLLYSSWIYSAIVCSGCVVVGAITAWISGTGPRFGSFFPIASALLLAFGELGLILAALGVVVRFVPVLVPAFAVAVLFYGMLSQVLSISNVTQGAHLDWVYSVYSIAPLLAVSVVIRDGLVGNDIMGALQLSTLVFAILGYGTLFIFWRTLTAKPSSSRHSI